MLGPTSAVWGSTERRFTCAFCWLIRLLLVARCPPVPIYVLCTPTLCADQVDQTVTWCATFSQKYISRLRSITCFPHMFQGPDTTQTEAEASSLAMDQAVAPCFFSVAVDTLNDRQRAEVLGTSLEGWTPHNLRRCCSLNYPAFRLWGWGTYSRWNALAARIAR